MPFQGVRTIRSRTIWSRTIRSRTIRYQDNSVPDNSVLGQFGTRTIWSRTIWSRNDHNSRNKNRKDLKFDFSFFSADSGSSVNFTFLKKNVCCKTLNPGFFWYAVDTDLIRLGFTNPKKKFPASGIFSIFFFICLNFFQQTFFFQKCSNLKTLSQGMTSRHHPLSFDLTFMKDAEQNEKNDTKILRFLFFKLS